MPSGTVKWFNLAKGYGFIRPQDGSLDVFVHVAALEAAGLNELTDGQRVTYDVVSARGRQLAENLKLGQ